MPLRLHFFALFIVLSTSIGLAAESANKTGKVRLGIHNFPPGFVMSGDGKTCSGRAVDILDRILNPVGLQIVPQCGTPARIYRQLDSGDLDIGISTITNPLVNHSHLFLTPPYTQLVLMLYSHPESATGAATNSVVAIRGFEYQGQRLKLIQQGFEFIEMPDAVSAINFFLHQRAQHLISYQEPFLHYLQQHDAAPQSQIRQQHLMTVDAQLVVSARSAYKERIIQAVAQYAARHQCHYLTACPPTDAAAPTPEIQPPL
ncbi:transporter substrate-binding domain-containing protein [Rheinheimera sp.]|uniref:transporter substrate-binding domain-containing protein n=1 Tax=Rheinheimera sp. TaxID=1869214 RepID=UPI00307EE4DF